LHKTLPQTDFADFSGADFGFNKNIFFHTRRQFVCGPGYLFIYLYSVNQVLKCEYAVRGEVVAHAQVMYYYVCVCIYDWHQQQMQF
jgi:hypothetical protein